MLQQAQIPVHWLSKPFVGPVIRESRPAGMSIFEIVASVDGLPARFKADGIVMVNGEIVPQFMWAQIRPRVRHDFDVVVTLHLPMRGGGGGGAEGGSGKNPLATIAAIALLVITTVITAGAFGPAGFALSGSLFGAGSISAALLAAGVGIAGSLAIAALTPPPVRNAENVTGEESASGGSGDDGKTAASLEANVLARGSSIPRVVGTHKVYPPLACPPLVELVGTDEFVEALYVLSGPHAFSTIKIGDTPIDDVEDLEYEIVEGLPGSGPVTSIIRQSYSDAPQLPLSRHEVNPASPQALLDQIQPENSCPSWHPVSTRRGFDEAWMLLVWPEGIADYGALGTSIGVPLRIQIRRRGDESWINLPEIHFSSKNNLPFQKVIKFLRQEAGMVIPLPPTEEGPYLVIKSLPGQTAKLPATGGWAADSYFSIASGGDVMSASTVGAHSIRNVHLYKDSVEIFLDPVIFPDDIYDINVTYGTSYRVGNFTPASYTYDGAVYDFFRYWLDGATSKLPYSRAQIHDKCSIGRLTSVWREHPIASGQFAAIAVRAKNRNVGRLSAIASGYVRDWNGTDWGDWVTTSNPAPHMVDVMTGSLNADPLPSDLVDNDGLVEWRQACIDNNYKINAVIEGGSVDDARLLIASAGYARPSQSEFWGVIRDKDRSAETPVQIFSPVNLSSFRYEKAFPRPPDGFRVIFNNKDDDYNEDERLVLRDGVDPTTADRVEEIRYAGLVEEVEITERAEFDLDQMDLRTTFYYGTADVESMVCRRGDLVGVQHDIIDHWAGFARIKEVLRSGGDVTGLVLTGTVPAPGSARFLARSDKSGVLFAEPEVLFLVAPNLLLETGDASMFLSPREFLTGRSHGAAIRLSDGTTSVVELVSVDSDDDVAEVEFSTPFSDPDELVQPDCHVTTGILGQEYRRLIVLDMKPDADLTANIVFVDEAPELWS